MSDFASDVESVWNGRRSGRVDTGNLTRGLSVTDGEAIQLGVLARLVATGETRSGWKVGMTSGAGRDSFGPGVRPFGYLLASRTFSTGVTVDPAQVNQIGLETELCFRIGRRVQGSDVDATMARDAVDAVAPAFEINEERLDSDADAGTRTADNLRQWGIVVGGMKELPQSTVFESLRSTIELDGDVLQDVSAAGHIDDHFESIAALARELSSFDLALEPGDLVITGAFTRISASTGGEYVGTFGELGTVSAQLELAAGSNGAAAT